MKKINTIIELTLIAIFTLALFLDFFPHPHMPDWFSYIFWSSLILLILSLILNKKIKTTEKEKIFFTFYLGIYVIALIILFSLTGGKSSSNISLSNPIIWIILISGIYTDWKKVRKDSNKARNDK